MLAIDLGLHGSWQNFYLQHFDYTLMIFFRQLSSEPRSQTTPIIYLYSQVIIAVTTRQREEQSTKHTTQLDCIDLDVVWDQVTI